MSVAVGRLSFGFRIDIGMEDGERQIVFQREHSQKDYCCRTAELLGEIGSPRYEYYPVYDGSGKTRCRVYILAEHQGFFIDEDVAYHSAEGSCYDSHDGCHPHGIIDGKRFVDAYNAEQGQTDAVKDKKDSVVAHEYLLENYHCGER